MYAASMHKLDYLHEMFNQVKIQFQSSMNCHLFLFLNIKNPKSPIKIKRYTTVVNAAIQNIWVPTEYVCITAVSDLLVLKKGYNQ